MKRRIVIGCVAGLGMFISQMCSGFLLNPFFPSVSKEYQNSNLFRPWSDPLMMLYFVQPFVLGIVLAFVWRKVQPLFPKNVSPMEGLAFGLWVFIIATIPGMLISYSTFPISLTMVLTWTISGLIELLIAGMIFAQLEKTR